MSKFRTGQRWMSESEPELGLATVVAVGPGTVQVEFRSVGETRTYAAENAPLKRVRLRVGDKAKTQNGKEFHIAEVREQEGLVIYLGEHERVPESQLSDLLGLQAPRDRLSAGRFDSSETFALRLRTLEFVHRMRKSPVRGFLGGRIALIPHQLYIAQEVANRHAARVMLSDEVGLGKTIEAGLILHRLILSGRADRILVLVPESLVHQWFVEMLRRFNIWFHIFDEERCAAIESGEPGANPFLDDQLVLTNLEFLVTNEHRAAQAVAAGWDMLVIDEAHHLQWSANAPSHEYQLVELLSRRSSGLLLLTATPEQLGVESHFARLRLLDPERYSDLVTFKAEAADYRLVAVIAEKLKMDAQLGEEDITILREVLARHPRSLQRVAELERGNRAARSELFEALLDLHGPGRVLFRNTRAGMTGFPARRVNLVQLEPNESAYHWLELASMEFAEDVGDTRLGASAELTRDPRVLWLVQLLQQLEPGKVLLICHSLEKAEALDAALRRHVSIKTAVFHEGLTLLQRDRNAAWFAEPEGARLLICSEIGSEGRNFQFAHHLVLFDLPLNPELLEQRIGRLDRIGQTQDIKIHVAYLARSPQEVLARWYHEGLNAFACNLEGGNELLNRFARAVHDLALEFPVAEPAAAESELSGLLERTKAARLEIRDLLERGRDRLLEFNSFRSAEAQRLIFQIREQDEDEALENYMLDVFEHFGVHAEELAPHTWQLNPQGVVTDSFPSIPPEGLIATVERRRAVQREDVAFLTWDHPMVTGAMDLLLGTEAGNCAFAWWSATTERTLLLELVFILECVADPGLHADRFLPMTPVHLLINHKGEELGQALFGTDWELNLQKAAPYKLIENPHIARRVLPEMFKRAELLAEEAAVTARESALQEMNRLLGQELERLEALALVNNHVRPEELRLARTQREQLATAIQQSRLRLDALRLIWKGPAEALKA